MSSLKEPKEGTEESAPAPKAKAKAKGKAKAEAKASALARVSGSSHAPSASYLPRAHASSKNFSCWAQTVAKATGGKRAGGSCWCKGQEVQEGTRASAS